VGLFSFRKKQESRARLPRIMDGQDTYTFRRSRTLTGTTSTKVAATAEHRSQLKTPRLQVHELQQERARVLKLLLGLSGGALVLVWLIATYIGSFVILYAQQPRTTAQPVLAGYQRSLQDYFASRPLQRFGFALDANQLQDFMRTQHSELANFTISRQWYGGGVQFVAAFRKPLLVWQTGGTRLYVDDQGIAFRYDMYGTPLVSVEDQSGIAPDVGTSVVSQRFIKFLGRMVGAVNKADKGQVSSIIIPASTREVDLKLQGREYPIKTEIDRDPLQQAQDIVVALNYFDAHSVKPQYIDVRVSGKAFYK